MELSEKEKKWAEIARQIKKLKEEEQNLYDEIQNEREEHFKHLIKTNIEKDDLEETALTLEELKEYMRENQYEKVDTVHLLMEVTNGNFEVLKGEGLIGEYEGFFSERIVWNHGTIGKLYLIKLKDGYVLIPYISSKANDHLKLSIEYSNIVDERVRDLLFNNYIELKSEKELLQNVVNKKKTLNISVKELNKILDREGDTGRPRNFKSIIGKYGYIYLSNDRNNYDFHYIFALKSGLKIISSEDTGITAKCFVRDITEEDEKKIKEHEKMLKRKISILEKVLKPWRVQLLYE